MHVTVLGAGVTGVTTAWSLLQAGFQVSVLDRRPGPAQETSFANGGQISVSHPEPWSSPTAPLIALRSIGRADAPLRLRLGREPQRWRWLLAFLRECLPARHWRNTQAIAGLALYSAACLRQLREHTGLQYEQRSRGILHLHYSEASLAHAREQAAMLKHCGIRSQLLSPQECLELEPTLINARRQLVGGLHAPDDESGDAQLFSVGLAELARQQGARFHYHTTITGLDCEQGRLRAIHVQDADGQHRLPTDAAVLCLGSYSPALLAPHGRRLPIYPVKGYSATLSIARPEQAPTISLTDESRRLVLSRLGDRLRIAGIAEICGYDSSLEPERIRPLLTWLEELFPGCADLASAEAWAGLRPCTPSYVPIIGRSGLDGLWLNTGHGSLGWTLACGSAELVTTLIAGHASPVPSFPLWQPGR